ncbi:MAG: pyridoxal-phosphate dependent enzyme [Chloroflexi bacterium]|nr:pyridoxal-phosphate dependent enzyme [Chloroflexota bacterium]
MFLKCTLCGKTYAPDEIQYVCPDHGDDGILDVMYDYDEINRRASPAKISESRENSVWRYWDLLPLTTPPPAPPLQVGWTPLYHAEHVGAQLGLEQLYIKDDGRNPTASFKDRASVVVVAKARELGVAMITTASSGNAGAALAGCAASAHIPATIFVPETAPQAKVAQLLMFGARVFLVRGTYDQASDLCLAASKEFGWYCRNTAYNPYTTEGKKTCALEICEQLALLHHGYPQATVTRALREMLTPQFVAPELWHAPDRIFVSVGDGNIISGIWKGLRDLYALGWIDKLPKLMGVQAEGSAACYNAWRAGTDVITPIQSHTIADSIDVGFPRDGRRAVRAVRATGGEFITVSDAEILDAMPLLARGEAVFAEPAASAAYAGLLKAVREQKLDRDETVVVVITGNGLKDIKSAMQAAGHATVIEPTLDAVRNAMT